MNRERAQESPSQKRDTIGKKSAVLWVPIRALQPMEPPPAVVCARCQLDLNVVDERSMNWVDLTNRQRLLIRDFLECDVLILINCLLNISERC